MTKLQRFFSLISGLLMIACGLVLLLQPSNGLLAIACAMGISLILYGVGKLFYYIRLAHHMTGGLSVLFMAIIAIDVGVFAAAVIDNPQLAVAVYLIIYYAISGVLAIARGVESKLFGSPWLLKVLDGVTNLALAALCIAFIRSDEIIIWLFCLGLFYNAGVRLASAFRPTEIIYIQ